MPGESLAESHLSVPGTRGFVAEDVFISWIPIKETICVSRKVCVEHKVEAFWSNHRLLPLHYPDVPGWKSVMFYLDVVPRDRSAARLSRMLTLGGWPIKESDSFLFSQPPGTTRNLLTKVPSLGDDLAEMTLLERKAILNLHLWDDVRKEFLGMESSIGNFPLRVVQRNIWKQLEDIAPWCTVGN